MIKQTKDRSSPLRYLLLATVIMSFLSIIMGGMLRTVGDTNACPGWPTCYGNWSPPWGHPTAWLDYAHRLTSATAGVMGLTALVWALIAAKDRRRVVRPLMAANVVMGLQVFLGRWIHLSNQMGFSTALHLGLALISQALTLYPLIASFPHPTHSQRKFKASPYARLSALTLSLTLLTLFTGAMVTVTGATASCAGWPLCQGWDLHLTPLQWLGTAHRLIVLGNAAALFLLFVRTWRKYRDHTAILTAAASAAVLFLSQGLMGAVEVGKNFPSPLLALHQATAVAVWSALIVHHALVRYIGGDRKSDTTVIQNRTLLPLAKDLLALTKPIVVALLLVTTFAGMVIGGESWPSLSTTFWVLLGGFMAAGGSSAINQYIDRQDDERMQRTQERPIPAGRLTPGEGLAFGVMLSIASFYLMVAFVNMVAALLTLGGIIYYVLIYSIFLKKTTVQNIVIGGGAGAVPPLVGWAAATGGLNIPSLFLFAVVFMWTPPHFWALAIVRRKDYARADVPMLPVVQGVKKTRQQIFVYTVQLVALTLLLPLIGLGGSIYFIIALALGGWLLSAAWKVLTREGNRFAWRMYRYSSMYLAFLFAALMADALL